MDPVSGKVVEIDETLVQKHLGEVVRSVVEDTLNALLDAEVDRLCGCRQEGAIVVEVFNRDDGAR